MTNHTIVIVSNFKVVNLLVQPGKMQPFANIQAFMYVHLIGCKIVTGFTAKDIPHTKAVQ